MGNKNKLSSIEVRFPNNPEEFESVIIDSYAPEGVLQQREWTEEELRDLLDSQAQSLVNTMLDDFALAEEGTLNFEGARAVFSECDCDACTGVGAVAAGIMKGPPGIPEDLKDALRDKAASMLDDLPEGYSVKVVQLNPDGTVGEI